MPSITPTHGGAARVLKLRYKKSAIARGRTMKITMNYADPDSLRDAKEKPAMYSEDLSRWTVGARSSTVTIQDARPHRSSFSLDQQGFCLVDHPTSVKNFERLDGGRSYQTEIERIIREITGASIVFAAPQLVLRYGEASTNANARANAKPARFVHSDFSTSAAEGYVAMGARGLAQYGVKPGQRAAIFNVWRALSEPPQDIPLGLCDARSVAETDRRLADTVIDAPGAPERRHESIVFIHNPEHRWYYFSGMTRDELLVFRTYDSDPAAPQKVPHAAFDDPSCPAGVPTRMSVEARALAYF